MRTSTRSAGSLVGRQDELRRIDELTGAAQAGQGGALVLRGEAGIGKSALLHHAKGSGLRVVSAAGSEFESELPFAGLHQLCAPVLGHLADLPASHREALEVAFGLVLATPDLFRIGLATLELLASAARDRPLLCVVDDAHWLDAASSRALAFVARRLGAEPVAMLFAVRLPGPGGELDELPGLVVDGLSDADARAFLAAESLVMLDEQVRDRLLAEARGNPLALRELPRAGGFAPPETSSVPTRIEHSFRARLADLPAAARLLLTVASADPTGDPALLWPAAQRLGIDVQSTSAAAIATGLVEFSNRIRFCHPLARSAVYLAAAADQRRTAHRVLAEVTDPVLDPDRRAWHRAQASAGPDDDVAAELERSASRARSRGGVAAAAAFLERAVALSLDGAARIERTLAAAQADLDAGATDRAADLITTVDNAALDELQHAHLDRLRGQIAFVRHHDRDGPAFVLRAARRLAGPDPERSRAYLLDALEMALVVGRATGVLEMVLEAARSAEPARSPDVLDALDLLATAGHRAAAPVLRTVLDGDDGPLWTRRPALASMLAMELWDPDVHAAVIEWLVKTGRDSGSPLVLRLGLALTTSHAALSGDLGQAMAAIAEEEAIADAAGLPPLLYPRLYLAAMRGRRKEGVELFRTATAAATAHGGGQLIVNVHWAAAVLHNGLADYPAALAAARQATAHEDLGPAGLSLPELVEAAVRCGEPGTAAAALEALTERTEASGTASGLGIAAYARGLATGVEEHYREAVERLQDTPLLPYRARAHLLYGEWLRREGRRRDCRRHLRTAHDLLSEAGLEAFARRAADELRASGEKARSRSGRTYDQLTMQEISIARLVATGATSAEVAARLFLSPRTVDAHLRNIFRKLGLTSRRQLRDHPDIGS
ncbi:AAA family ATPase [Pseudonocardia cypriaca]|uniref:Regulatory LuxR family protein n=1 Tax=Pseudonocardia cypriaca TaxID=882449 RepID=A0A543GC08_9PSEU|nr:LuxR family transcriptional regulator [Pseudonocardia cypriaca]TQM43621.1 regulatory LuxR family protein [Pseudonocardia cypriaca]